MARTASHKFQHAQLTARSSLDPGELLALADEVASGVTAATLSGSRETWVHPSKRSPQRHDYWVGRLREGKKNVTRLRFVVEVTPSSDGQTTLKTGISFFRTQQPMFFGLIPSGPKQLQNYGYYKRFMINLEDGMRERDPEAETTIRERE